MEKKLNNQMVPTEINTRAEQLSDKIVRAEYGKGILKRVSERLTERLGKGWSVENLRQMRKFFVTYSQHYSIGANNGRKKTDSVLEIRNLPQPVATSDETILPQPVAKHRGNRG